MRYLGSETEDRFATLVVRAQPPARGGSGDGGRVMTVISSRVNPVRVALSSQLTLADY